MSTRFYCLVFLIAFGGGTFASAVQAGEGDSVVVIYNSREPQSKVIAEHYAERRSVPKTQVLGFEMTTEGTMTRADYVARLQGPLLSKLDSLKLWRFGISESHAANGKPAQVERKVLESKIRYVVLCYGIPWAIARDSSLKEAAEETLRPELRRNEAAVDNELACLPMVYQNLPLTGPLHNPHYTTTNEWAFNPTNGLLMVTRLDGPSPQLANALVDKAIEAETDGLWGRAYVDLRNTTDPGFKMGDDWMRGAAEACRHFGFDTVVDESGGTFSAGFPMSQIAIYVGWYSENVDGPFALPKVEFMPGAFAYHLHSFSAAALHSTNRNWTGPLLAKGATISMGTVDEPYLAGTSDVGVFVARFLYQNFDFGAAAYASQSVLSWQTTVIGDPLYRPFKKSPPQIHRELEARHSKLVEWSHERVVNLNLVQKFPASQMIAYLDDIPTTKESAVLQEKMGDLCELEGKPSSAILAYQQALKLAPSPQQRIRLRLTLGEQLTVAKRDDEAYDNYQRMLEESPDFPDKVSVQQKLALLAQKLGKKDDATKFEGQIKALPPATQR